jgi:hypothetical protein
MTRSRSRLVRFLRWHFARLEDGEARIVRVPVRGRRVITGLQRRGDYLYVQPWDSLRRAYLRMQ